FDVEDARLSRVPPISRRVDYLSRGVSHLFRHAKPFRFAISVAAGPGPPLPLEILSISLRTS
ncbi:MAG TPA: hypothetical protein VG477_07625, partial [Thermoanaerobaculia bacterium]|nr:hypothetical protein [Thermoanaerobaculia bacterium]